MQAVADVRKRVFPEIKLPDGSRELSICRDPGRVFFYDVAGCVEGKKVKTRRALADGYWHAASKLGHKRSCVFLSSDFPEGKTIEICVRPLDAFLIAGRLIVCTLKA